jgi:hypothetical protein
MRVVCLGQMTRPPSENGRVGLVRQVEHRGDVMR